MGLEQQAFPVLFIQEDSEARKEFSRKQKQFP
jgi:hypothetical protein